MTDLGHYKTWDSRTFRCHFNPEKKKAIAIYPGVTEIGIYYCRFNNGNH